VDLHIHSTTSDGLFSPAEIVKKAAGIGMRVISLCDHDTVDGITEALDCAQSFPHLKVIPGIEISTDVPQGEIHILGYFIDYKNPEFLKKLSAMHFSRIDRARKMVVRLASLGIKIEFSRVQELAVGSTVGRPHIAQAMLERGYITSFKEAFDRYIGRNGPAYVERDKMTPVDAVRLVLQYGGLPVFAHPMTFNGYETMTNELVNVGLIGIEVYYKNWTSDQLKQVLALAQQYSLIPTGGSDFHGVEPDEVPLGGVEVPLESANQLIKMAEKRMLSNK